MKPDVPHLAATRRKSALERLLSLAADVRAGEGITVVLLALNGFLLLAAYYAIRPVRSALLLRQDLVLPGGTILKGEEITSYLGACHLPDPVMLPNGKMVPKPPHW